ncbi:MAG: glycosyltransferase [Bacteroidia bacterium]|nr:glycosyltransferase [Bacteroidia bacterium]
MTKKLSSSEMEAYWRRAIAFISAPLYDGYSYAIAEGRWYGALPIVSAIPGNLEVITHGYNGWVVEPFTRENLASTLLTVEKHWKEVASLWQLRNKKWIKSFSDIRKNAELFLHTVENFLSSSNT